MNNWENIVSELEEECATQRNEIDVLKKRVYELESELSVKENLLKIKNGLCGEKPRIHIIGLREFGGEQYMRFSDVEDLIKELEES